MAIQRILFCRIDWAEKYDGSKEDIENRRKRPEINCQFGHELFNFRNFEGTYYGFVEFQNNNDYTIHIENLGATLQDGSISNVLVVWCATKPQVGGMYIVGWYEDATVYRYIQTLPNKIWETKKKEVESNLKTKLGKEDLDWLKQYRISCNQNDAVLVPCEKRTQQVEGFGQANIWYGNDEEIRKAIEYIGKYKAGN